MKRNATVYLLFILLIVPSLSAKTLINVGISQADQIPFTFNDGSGLARDLIDLLNSVQNHYRFQQNMIPPKRARTLLYDGYLDIVSFSNIHWDWKKDRVSASVEIIRTRDLYVAQKKPGRDEMFFDQVGKIATVGVLGFHYRFTGFSTDSRLLKTKFNMILIKSESRIVDMLLLGRGEIGVIASSVLDYLKISKPQLFNQLLISKRFDREYSRSFLISKSAPITTKEMNSFLINLKATGALQTLYGNYGVQVPDFRSN